MMSRSKFGLIMTLVMFVVLLSGSSPAAQKGANAAAAVKKQAVSAPQVTFVEIGSVNCIPCRAMQPIMKAVEEEYKGVVKVVFHDVWTPKGKEDAMKYNIRVIPTQVFLDKNGQEYFRHEGYFPKEGVVEAIRMQGIR